MASLSSAFAATEGGGVPIRRAFPTSSLENLDPFLLFDHFGPLDYKPGEATGFPDHPHRGFETVTYLLEGSFEHRDSFGNHGLLEAGDVQWMTAGSGLVHSEMPGQEIQKNGGRVQGFQIWVNLPRAEKLTAPKYQELKASRIPTAITEDRKVTARIVAGEAIGIQGTVQTHTPILNVHFTLMPDGTVSQQIPASRNAMAYVVSGQAIIGRRQAPEGSLAVFQNDGDSIQLSNASENEASVLVLAGEPLNEPVARYGPFVMNTRDELTKAFEDFRNGKMGTIA